MYSKVIPDAVKSDGTKVPYETGKGYTFGVGTFFVDVSLPDARDVAVHVTWDAVVAGTVNYQDSNLPAFKSLTNPYSDNSGAADVSNRDLATGATLGVWLPQNVVTGSITTTAGAAVASSTLTIAGGTAGGAKFEIVDALRRGRMQLVIGTGGVVRIHTHGKQA